MKKQQAGSAHMIVVIVLVLALIAALGVIFYQRFSNANSISKKSTSHRSTAKKVNTKLDASEKMKKYGTNLELSYPKSWKIDHTQMVDRGVDAENLKITSPDKKTRIILYQTTTGQFGGACGSDGNSQITSLSKKTLRGYSQASYYQAINRHKNDDGNYIYSPITQVLANDSDTKNAKVGSDGCNIFNTHGILSPAGDTDKVQATLTIEDDGLMDVNSRATRDFKQASDIQKVFDSRDYKIAVKIVQSLKEKK